jgi:hypothetical protein
MSFQCFVPGGPVIGAEAFQQVDVNRWVVNLSSPTPIGELACFITSPLAPGQALGCHIASAPFESWHYLGSITSDHPSVVFKTRYVWSAADAVPTAVQFGVVMEQEASLAQSPAERVSAEVLEAARRIGQDLYTYLASFAVSVNVGGESKIQLPSNALEGWLNRFSDKCRHQGLDWLNSAREV